MSRLIVAYCAVTVVFDFSASTNERVPPNPSLLFKRFSDLRVVLNFRASQNLPVSVMLFAFKSRNVSVVLTVRTSTKGATLLEVIELSLSAIFVRVEFDLRQPLKCSKPRPPILLPLRESVVITELQLRPLANSATVSSLISVSMAN